MSMRDRRKKSFRYKNFAEVFKKRRKELKLTQDDVAEHIGVTSATVKNWEYGIYEPPTTKIKHICEVMGIDVETMLNVGE